MQSVWLNRSVVALMGSTCLLMVVTAFSSSASQGLGIPEWANFGHFAHRRLAEFVSLLAVGTLLVTYRGGGHSLHQKLSAGIVVGVFLLAGLGMGAAKFGTSAALGVMQASLLHFVFAAMVVLVLVTKPAWTESPTFVEDEFRPSLRLMAWMPALLIGVQIVLGSAYRHGLVGVIPHFLGAFVVAGLLALVGLLVATAYPKHPPLRQAALGVVWMMLAQIMLGVMALSYRAQATGGGAVWDKNFVLFTVGHVLLGSFTLASCVWLAVVIRKHVVDAVAAPTASLDGETA
ncbi:MAG: hypothetical protein KIT83_12320 [Bryobacterales bacterium]|nr:hypothetical protein [Bryobacterales bacterium]